MQDHCTRSLRDFDNLEICVGEEGHYASNCTVKPRKRDDAYLQTQLQIAQKDEAGIQLNSEEFDFMAAAGVYDEIEKISAEVHHSKNCYDNDIFNMFTQEEQYTELLKPIPEPHQVQQNDSNVISAVSSVEQSGGTVEQHPVNVEETRVLYDSLYNNLAIEVEKVNSVIRKLRETNADLTFELARYKNQEKCFEINQEKYNKLEREKVKDTTLYVSNTLDPLSQKLKNENVELEFQVSEQKDITHGTSTNTKFAKPSILGKPPSSSRPKLYVVTPLPKSKAIPKIDESHALSKLESLGLILLKLLGTDLIPKILVSLLKTLKALLGPEDRGLGTILRVMVLIKWSPTGRIFDINGKTIATGEPVCQSDCSKGDNASTSNPQEPINKRFPSSTFSMTRCQNWLDTLLIPLLSEYKPKDKENHGDNECDI
ncbi:hypothetical protein Tco_1362464 [Tanacetum coccineum]